VIQIGSLQIATVRGGIFVLSVITGMFAA